MCKKAKKWVPLFPGELRAMNSRTRALARLKIANPHLTKAQLAAESGYSEGRVHKILLSRVFKEHIAKLENRQDDRLVNYRNVASVGALQALKRMVAIVTPGTKEYESSTIREKIEAAKELMDRCGHLPKVKHNVQQPVSQVLTAAEIAQLTGRKP